MEPPPDWQTNSFSDQDWPRGRGLLGHDDNAPAYTPHAPILTDLTISSAVTSYYFRTTFQFTGDTTGLILVATNLVDDGCTVYLNGVQVLRQRMPINLNAATLASSGPSTEGTLEPTTLTDLSALRQGENLIAAEVHQNASTSSDIMWGMQLVSIRDLPLQVLAEPQDLAREVGQSAQFAFPVAGGRTTYRWYRPPITAPIVGATGATFQIPSVVLASSGIFYAIVTNRAGSITSRWATLTVFEDHTGPRLLNATATTPQGNIIEVSFSEPLDALSATNPTNYFLTRYPSNGTVAITNAQTTSALTLVRLFADTSEPDWVAGAQYYLTVNHVADRFTNGIAPDSRIAISLPSTRFVLGPDTEWSFHAAAIFDPFVLNEAWTQPRYQEGPWWGQGRGVFASGAVMGLPCLGESLTSVGFQPEPILFRTSFLWPGELGTQARLRVLAYLDDGAVIYLNGSEVWRFNMPTGPLTPLTPLIRASANSFGFCNTNSFIQVDNLRAGTNWIAAASVSAPDTGNFTFALQMTATTLEAGALPDNPAPNLRVEPVDATTMRLSWVGAGYALESSTNLGPNRASMPEGPWEQVPNMRNPYLHVYTNNPDDPPRFFRLKR